MLVTFGTHRVKQDFLNLQNRCYFFAFFGHEAGLECETSDGKKRGSRACLGFPLALRLPSLA